MSFVHPLLLCAFFQGSPSVVDFGAVPDDGLDDTVAIQAALDACCAANGGEVFFPPGTYDVSRLTPPAPGMPWVILRLGCPDLTLRGASNGTSRLRVADAQGDFESLLGSETFAQDVSGLRLLDLVLDGNGANNPVSGDEEVDGILRETRHALRVYVGFDVVIERCQFLDWRNRNVLTLNGVDVGQVVVRDCLFGQIGVAPGLVADWDHSSIYTDCDGALIERNVFVSADGPGTLGVRAAIETHGPDQVVRRNLIRDYTTGMNATGVSVLGSATQQIVGNRFIGVSDGIRLWSYDVPGDPPGAAIRDMVVCDNQIEVEVDGWRGTQDPFGLAPSGISLERSSDSPITQLAIERNHIEFRVALTQRPYDGLSAGISINSEAVPELAVESVLVRDNHIERPLGPGLYVGGGLADWIVRDNVIEMAGQGNVNDGFRSAVIVFGDYRNLDFGRTCIEDPLQRLEQAFYLFEQHAGGSSIRATAVLGAAPGLVFARSDTPLSVPWLISPPTKSCTW